MSDDTLVNEEIISRLRDCFYAGYTLPQFCIDDDIKKPLFLAAQDFDRRFIWEIYVQFLWDKRISPTFATLEKQSFELQSFEVKWFLNSPTVKTIYELGTRDFDKVFLLTARRLDFDAEKVIYLDELMGMLMYRVYWELPLCHFAHRHPEIKLFAINFPMLKPNPLNTELEKIFLRKGDSYLEEMFDKFSLNTGEHVATPFDFLGYSNEQVRNLLKFPTAKTNPDGSTVLVDDDDKYLVIHDGKRLTANQPETFDNRIYFVGNCIYFGWGVPFDKTLTSRLQRLLNENHLPWRVENESQIFGNRHQDIFYNLNNLPLRAGDIVFVCTHNVKLKNFPFVDVEDVFQRPHDFGEVFFDPDHLNELGHKALGEIFFALLTQNNFFRDVELRYPHIGQLPHRYGIPPQFDSAKTSVNAQLEDFKQKLRAHKLQIGALVMNCNPFTLGHLHLVEYAAARVALLYIFVVEEDKSEFPFADRFELVRQGVKNFRNVEVLPSGQFIISQQTFSGYFNKAELQDVPVDSSEDVEIFATEIAPTLGITIRFAGEEPTDSVTRQYNETMRRILPRHGIEFREIPRKTFGGEVISASTVRELLKRGDFDTIKNLVPETTFDYLRQRPL